MPYEFLIYSGSHSCCQISSTFVSLKKEDGVFLAPSQLDFGMVKSIVVQKDFCGILWWTVVSKVLILFLENDIWLKDSFATLTCANAILDGVIQFSTSTAFSCGKNHAKYRKLFFLCFATNHVDYQGQKTT